MNAASRKLQKLKQRKFRKAREEMLDSKNYYGVSDTTAYLAVKHIIQVEKRQQAVNL